MPAKKPITPGTLFGKWKVRCEAETYISPKGRPVLRYWCDCECGKSGIVRADKLLSGWSTSCGCSRADGIAKHGHARRGKGGKTKTYNAWRGMICRCYNRTNNRYQHYGGRGIIVCDGWKADYINFRNDMGDQPPGRSIERINNDKNYSCGKCEHCIKNGFTSNCRWATALEQSQNTSRSMVFTVRGVTGSLSLLCRHFGVKHYGAVRRRLYDGLDIETALFTPPNGIKRDVVDVKHGYARRGKPFPQVYKVWRLMMRRCYDRKFVKYKYYGGKGATVADGWRSDFLLFVADMGECPDGRVFRRLDPNKPYEKQNCAWVVKPDATR